MVRLEGQRAYTLSNVSDRMHDSKTADRVTFREEAAGSVCQVPSQIPSIPKVIVALNQFYPVPFG